ncbi:MAG: S9 family peptidase, partial [Duganella sp.]
MLRYALPALLLASILPTYAQSAAAAADIPLIERSKIFGNPTKTGANISPDGKWLSWIAPRDGVLNVWVAPASDLSKAKPLTDEKTRPIRSNFWSPDSSTVLFIQDKGGDENFLLYGVDVVSGKQTNYTPFEKTRVQIVNISSKVKDRILIGLNNRDPRWHDVHSLDLKTGKLTLVQKNEGYGSFVADEQLKLRLAQKPAAGGGVNYFRITDGKIDDSKPMTEVGLDDVLTTAPLGFTVDGKTLYWADSRNRNTSALLAQDVASGKTSVVAEDPRADIGGALLDKRTGRVLAYSVEYLKQEYFALSKDLKGDLDFLKKNVKGEFSLGSRTDAD